MFGFTAPIVTQRVRDASHTQVVPRPGSAGNIHAMGVCHRPGLPLALRLQRRAALAGFSVNAVSAAMVGLYMTVVFPPTDDRLLLTPAAELGAVALYTSVPGVTSYRRAAPVFEHMRTWLAGQRPPTPAERRAVLRVPVLFARMTVVRWGLAVPVFALPPAWIAPDFALDVATTIVLAGISTAAAVYLAIERLLRPAFALALDPSAPPEARALGIGPRLLLTWLLCSGVPILMVALIPVGRDVSDARDLSAPIWFAA